MHSKEGEGNDRTQNILPEAMDHPALHALISTVTSQGFAKPRHCVPVQQEASGTEVRKCIRSQARSRESTELQAESSTKRILRLPTGDKEKKTETGSTYKTAVWERGQVFETERNRNPTMRPVTVQGHHREARVCYVLRVGLNMSKRRG